MFHDGCVALPCGAMGLSAVVIVAFPDHNHLLFLLKSINIMFPFKPEL